MTISGSPLAADTRHTPGLDLLRGDPCAVAIVTDDETIPLAELRRRVDRRTEQLGAGRRLVLIEAENRLDPLVTYLAALAAGHVVLLMPPGASGGVLERYDPDVVLRAGATDLEHRREGSAHRLHPELALLLSTSGSTGSPKLVRLSRRNIESNAASIARYLEITPVDRAITTLPFSYCYGLSVIHSHLWAGAGVRLTSTSVMEHRFWSEFTDAGCTSFAGVPYTFDLLDAAGFADRELPTLRYVTQAGGRLEPERVRAYAREGSARGFDFVVMYGQTEATARMAYLPPNLAEKHAGMIGIPIPGGSLEIENPDHAGIGELVYRGENVMMGYAENPDDLSAGGVLTSLRTGDLARRHDDGLFEVVGRVSRFVKVFGLRVDLDRVQRLLSAEGVEAWALGIRDRLVLAVRAPHLPEDAASAAARLLDLPAHAIEAHCVAEFPRTPTGKPDWAGLADLIADQGGPDDHAATSSDEVTTETLRRMYAQLLERPDVGLDDSFTSLDGDSLSYVEVSVRLEELLGDVPAGWPSMSVRELAGRGESARATPSALKRTARIETSVMLRAVAIVLITATHADLFAVQGGAHLLLALLGLNLARFQLAKRSPASRVRSLLRSAAGIAVPAIIWIGGVALVTGMYRPSTVLLMNGLLGDGERWTVQWQYWFLEAAVWSIVGLAALAAVPSFDRVEQRRPFLIAMIAFALAMAVRLISTGIEAGPVERYSVPATAWLIALGWVIARASTRRTRVVTSLLIAVSVPGFFGNPGREAVVLAGLLLVLWLPTVPAPRPLLPVVRVIAAASLFIYLVHWQVYPWLEDVNPLLATLASFAAGIVAWRAHRLMKGAWAARSRRGSGLGEGAGHLGAAESAQRAAASDRR